MDIERAERKAAIVELMALPDPRDLHRGHSVTAEGHPERYALIPELCCAGVTYQVVQRDNERLQ